MIPFEALTELFGIATRPWTEAVCGQPPTSSSVERIQRELGVKIPEDYVRVALACPSYCTWLASIGEDYEGCYHILRLNAVFHDSRDLHDGEDGSALDPHLVMLNHGHDLDCDCWDTRRVTASGEHPIIYVSLASDNVGPGGLTFDSFRAYAEHFALHYAPRCSETGFRRRAKRVIQELGITLHDHEA